MIRFCISRMLQAVAVVLIVSVISFVLLKLIPGDPARAMLGPQAGSEDLAQFRSAMGYDKPVPVQYLMYMRRLVTGDLGRSIVYNQPVTELLAERLPRSAILFVLSTVVALLIGIPLGVLQGARRNRWIDHLATSGTFLFYSTPVFFLGLMLIYLFAIIWPVFPPVAPNGSTVGEILSQPAGLVLPVLTIALLTLALFSRYVRASVIDRLAEDYVRTARAKGLRGGEVLRRHVLRNALGPVVTLLGLMLPGMFAGAMVTEYVFNFQGMGLLFYDSVVQYDYAPLMAIILLVSVTTVLGGLLADLGYAYLDPRVKDGVR